MTNAESGNPPGTLLKEIDDLGELDPQYSYTPHLYSIPSFDAWYKKHRVWPKNGACPLFVPEVDKSYSLHLDSLDDACSSSSDFVRNEYVLLAMPENKNYTLLDCSLPGLNKKDPFSAFDPLRNTEPEEFPSFFHYFYALQFSLSQQRPIQQEELAKTTRVSDPKAYQILNCLKSKNNSKQTIQEFFLRLTQTQALNIENPTGNRIAIKDEGQVLTFCFPEEEWERLLKYLVWNAYLDKEGKPKPAAQGLLDTGNKILLARVPNQNNLGVKLSWNDSEKSWEASGKNILGKLLMEMREYLRKNCIEKAS